MTKTVAFIGTDGGVSFSALGFDQALSQIGNNTGNAIFQYAVWRRLENPKFLIGPGVSPETVRERADVVVIPAANQVNPAWDMGGWADLIEAIDLPCVMVGLGAQAPINGEADLTLKPGSLRYFKAVAERATTIGVRGSYTQEVLARLGITNTVVTGCPSQTINPHLTGDRIDRMRARVAELERPRVAHVMGTMEEETRATERALTNAVKDLDHHVIYQTGASVLRLLFDRNVTPESRKSLAWAGQQLRPDLTADEYLRYVGWRGRFYSDARSWIDAMARFDVVLGMRIHGAIAGVQAGRLGICVAFDSRTLELAETMGYPYVLASDIVDGATVHSIVDSVRFDAVRFDVRRVEHSARIEKILTDAGCSLNWSAHAI